MAVTPGVNYQGSDLVTSPTVFANTVTFAGATVSGFATSPAAVTTPSFPATTVSVTNTTGVDVMAYITNGAASMGTIKVNGTSTGLTVPATTGNASIYLAAGATFVCTYASGTPTWVWLAV